MALTNIAIKALRPKKKRYKIFDGQGLHLEVQPSGSKIWRIRYYFNNKEKRFTIGHYPEVSIKEARATLANVLDKLADGVDPMSGDSVALLTEGTFQATAEDWLDKQAPRRSDKHKNTVHTRLQKYAYPHIGQKGIAEISPQDVLHLLRLIESQNKHETAHRVLGICSQVFRFGVYCGMCESDPCRDLKGALTAYVEKPFAAITTPKEAGGLMRSIRSYTGSTVTKTALLWSAYTFCRLGEVRRAEWSEIDWKNKEWRIPAEKMKRVSNTVYRLLDNA